jgi:O-antigen ligase
VEWNWLYCTAHNDLLEYLVTMGVVGAACKLLMYILPFVMYARGKERKPEKAAVLAALVGYIGQGLFTGPYILTYVFYIILLGVMCAYDRMEKAKGAKA